MELSPSLHRVNSNSTRAGACADGVYPRRLRVHLGRYWSACYRPLHLDREDEDVLLIVTVTHELRRPWTWTSALQMNSQLRSMRLHSTIYGVFRRIGLEDRDGIERLTVQ